MTFYEIVLKEYKSNDETFICRGSEKFRKAWHYKAKREIIAKHAVLFLNDTQRPMLLNCNIYRKGALFGNSTSELRIDFLNWCIKNNLNL